MAPEWLGGTHFFLLLLGPFPLTIITFELKRTERS